MFYSITWNLKTDQKEYCSLVIMLTSKIWYLTFDSEFLINKVFKDLKLKIKPSISEASKRSKNKLC